MNPSDIDFRRSCRLCLKLETKVECKVSLYDEDETNDSFIMPCKIYACLAIMVYRGDPFSSWVCESCNSKLDAFDLFKRECTASDLRLKQQYKMLRSVQKETVEGDQLSQTINPVSCPFPYDPPPLSISSAWSLTDNVLKPVKTGGLAKNRSIATATSVDVTSIHSPISTDDIMPNIKQEPIDCEDETTDTDQELAYLDNFRSNVKLVPTSNDKLRCLLLRTSTNAVAIEPSINEQQLFDYEDKTSDIDQELVTYLDNFRSNVKLVVRTSNDKLRGTVLRTCADAVALKPSINEHQHADHEGKTKIGTDQDLTNPDHFWSTKMVALVPTIKMEPTEELENGVEGSADNVSSESRAAHTVNLRPFTNVGPNETADSFLKSYKKCNISFLKSYKKCNIRPTSNNISSLSGSRPKLLSSVVSSRLPMVSVPNSTVEDSNVSTGCETLHTENNFKVEAVDIDFDEGKEDSCSRDGDIDNYTPVQTMTVLNEGTHHGVNGDDKVNIGSEENGNSYSFVPLDENASLAEVSSKPIVAFSGGIITYRNEKRKLNRASHKCTYRKCTKTFPRRSALRRHRETHAKPQCKYPVCSICPKSFTTKDFLKDHEKSHFSNGGNSCKLCGIYFATIQAMRAHLKDHTELESTAMSLPTVRLERGDYACELCGRRYNYFESFKKHVKHCQGQRRNIKCVACGELMTANEVSYHAARCTKTNAAFTPEELLMPFKCHMCRTYFATPSELSGHVARSHPDSLKPPGVVTCSLCHKSFETQRELLVHEQQVHNVFLGRPKQKAKPVAFLCSLCGKEFPQKGALICHQAFYHREEVNKKINSTPFLGTINYKRPH